MNAEMNEMIDGAEKQGKWLYCQYQSLWFSPSELRKAQAEGRFQWGAVNWRLRDPMEHLAEIEQRVTHATRSRDDFKNRLESNSVLDGNDPPSTAEHGKM